VKHAVEGGERRELTVHAVRLHAGDIVRGVEELGGGLLGETFECHGRIAGGNVEAAGGGLRGGESDGEQERSAHECAEREAGVRAGAAVRATAGRGEAGHAGDEGGNPKGGVIEADGRRAQNC
jgi:hypothetical protein